MRRAVIALIALVTLRCASSDVQHTPVAPNDVAARVDAVFEGFIEPGSPGCAVGIARGGRVTLERGYGLADLEHDIPITPATVFEAGSVSKQFVGAAVAMLASEGKLSLDDRARKYLPELDESADAITIRQLLNHTSGLRDFGAVIDVAGWPRGSRVFTHADILDVMSKQRSLNFEPGTQWTYNTGAYNLLAVIVERVSGDQLPDLTRRRIFEPLGMRSSGWRDDVRRVVKGRATSYARSGRGFRKAIDVESIYGNCCMLTTVGDLLRWNENFTSAAAVGPEALDQMQVTATLKDGRPLDYGLGLFIDRTPGRRAVSHSGATAGYRAWLTRRIDDDLSIALLCNRADTPGTLVNRIAAAVLDRPMPAPPPAANAGDGPELAGLWRDPKTDAILRIDVDDGKLRVRPRATGQGTELVAGGQHRFRAGSNELRLAPDGLHVVSPRKPEAVYTRVDAVTPDARALAEYSGVYASEEADATWKVAVEGDRLVAHPRAAVSIALDPTYADAFLTDENNLVSFTRDASGRIDGLDVKWEFSMVDGAARLERLHFRRVE